jgi:hypothetical protein
MHDEDLRATPNQDVRPRKPPAKAADPHAAFLYLRTRALAAIYYPRPAPKLFTKEQKRELQMMTAEVIGDRPITYLEFGVFKGRSIKRISEAFPHADSRFYGFDSFEGLPEDWLPSMKKGHFSTDGALPDLGDPRITFVKGYFQNTLPAFIAAHELTGPVLVNFDADLYSSTLFLLTTLWHHLPEYYFLYDEFTPHEVIAMYDFSQAYPVEYEFFASTIGAGLPRQVFGHMKRAALVP